MSSKRRPEGAPPPPPAPVIGQVSVKESCSNCRFYSVGVCRRYPPVSVFSHGMTVSDFPILGPSNWCGEWEAMK